MNISNTIIINTEDFNNILRKIDFEELRKNNRIELIEKSSDQYSKENTIINYSWHMDDTTEIIPFSAILTVQENYDGITESITIDIEFSPEEILAIITEYFYWMSIPYKAIGVTQCTKMEGTERRAGVLDFGYITVKIEKILEKKRKRTITEV